jgi:vancomycin resistance protein VanJ
MAVVRPAAVAAGVAYSAALVLYSAGRARTVGRTGLVELANDFAPWLYAPAAPMLLAGIGWRAPTLAAAGLASTAAFLGRWGRLFAPRMSAPTGVRPELTVMTFNVLAWNRQYAATAGVILAEAPDVVAVQELDPLAAVALLRLLADQYPHRALQPYPSPSGAGVFSRHPLRDAEAFRLGVAGGHWSQRMVVEAPSGPLTLFNVHTRIPRLCWERRCGLAGVLPTFSAERCREDVRRLARLLDEVDGPLLVMGDFNMTEYSAHYRLVRARLTDAYRAVGWGFGHTFPRLGSFPHGLPVPWPMVRLDYVWHSAHFRPLSARLGRAGGSDHHPVIVRLARVPSSGFTGLGSTRAGDTSPRRA